MAYASIEDVWKRKGTDIPDTDYVTALLDDAAIIIDAYNRNATDDNNVWEPGAQGSEALWKEIETE